MIQYMLHMPIIYAGFHVLMHALCRRIQEGVTIKIGIGTEKHSNTSLTNHVGSI